MTFSMELLPAPLGPIIAENLAPADLEADAVEGTNAAKRQADVFDTRQYIADPSRRCAHALRR